MENVKGNSYMLNVIRNDPCSYCGTPLTAKTFTKDHIQARNKRGQNNWTNITAACKVCNNRKDNLTLLEHLLGLPRHAGTLKFRHILDPSNRTKLPKRWYKPIRIDEDTTSLDEGMY